MIQAPGAYPRVEYMKSASLGDTPVLFHKHYTRQKKTDKDKHSRLLQKVVNYGHEKFLVQALGLIAAQTNHKVFQCCDSFQSVETRGQFRNGNMFTQGQKLTIRAEYLKGFHSGRLPNCIQILD